MPELATEARAGVEGGAVRVEEEEPLAESTAVEELTADWGLSDGTVAEVLGSDEVLFVEDLDLPRQELQLLLDDIGTD